MPKRTGDGFWNWTLGGADVRPLSERMTDNANRLAKPLSQPFHKPVILIYSIHNRRNSLELSASCFFFFQFLQSCFFVFNH
ncbi:hypothetical protein, partial [Paenibacillus forsythiae]|uniref:hypothetical protein n=1 Tax=Paenibacillus forsythiae TaxID=365616 RepID=UPI0005634746